MSITRSVVAIAAVLMCLNTADCLSLAKSKDNKKHNSMTRTETLCRRTHDYCGFVVVHSATRLQTPIPGWCECDKQTGSECIFSTINARKQWIFTCQQPQVQQNEDDEEEKPLKITFQEVVEQFRRSTM